MSPHCVWLVIVGGCTEREWRDVGGGVKKAFTTFVTDTNKLIMTIELGKSYLMHLTILPTRVYILFMHLQIILIHNVILYSAF